MLTALEQKKQTGKSLARTLIEMGIVSESKLTEVLAQHLGLEFVDLASYRVDLTAVALLDEKMAQRHLTIPLAFDGDTLIVAMADPTNIFALDDVKMSTGHQVRPVVATKSDIEDAIRTYYRESGRQRCEKVEELESDDDGRQGARRRSSAPRPTTRRWSGSSTTSSTRPSPREPAISTSTRRRRRSSSATASTACCTT